MESYNLAIGRFVKIPFGLREAFIREHFACELMLNRDGVLRCSRHELFSIRWFIHKLLFRVISWKCWGWRTTKRMMRLNYSLNKSEYDMLAALTARGKSNANVPTIS